MRCITRSILPLFLPIVMLAGCGTDEVTMREIARDEARKTFAQYEQTFAPETTGFGTARERAFPHAQGVKSGTMIFIAGQPGQNPAGNAAGGPDPTTGDFRQQFRASLENVKAILATYDATMDDVVLLQTFVDAEAGPRRAGDYHAIADTLIAEYFPRNLQTMTFVEVAKLTGPEQLVETNAIAVVKPSLE